MTSNTCYSPDGSQITDSTFRPCDQFTNVYSMCCATGRGSYVVCAPNGICLGHYVGANNSYAGPDYTRGSCTDRTWQSPYCLRNVCTDPAAGGVANGDSKMTLCGDGTWCCGVGNTTCCSSKHGFSLPPIIEATTTVRASVSNPTSASTITTTATANADSSEPLSHAGIALVTVGAVLLVAAITAFALLYRKIAQKRRRDNATPQQPAELDESWQKSELPVGGPTHELIVERDGPAELYDQN